jgi:dihydroorotase
VVIRGGRIVDAGGTREGDVFIQDGIITSVSARVSSVPAGTVVLDATGCVVAPGLVDLHTHLREPGREEAETVETGSRAAALGGYTAVVAMPNTEPGGRGASWRPWRSWPPSGCASSPTTAPACRTPA